ncbi:hypothetical protein [Romboutsia sp.]|uniref:hypothetical protein n=1 Tax=Romboutsia sp. TaxID=1965302 RepID=UPI003F3AE916
MSAYIRIIYDRLDFIEFKQNILLLKQPQHKASIFVDITLEEFLKIRDFTLDVSNKISSGKKYSIEQYEKSLFDICPLIKSYPSSSTLVAKALMNVDIFNSLFIGYN